MLVCGCDTQRPIIGTTQSNQASDFGQRLIY